MKLGATKEQVRAVEEVIRVTGYRFNSRPIDREQIIITIGDYGLAPLNPKSFESMAGVERVLTVETAVPRDSVLRSVPEPAPAS